MKCVLLAIILGLLACPWGEAQSEEQGCVVELGITGDFLHEPINPEVATLNGKDMRDNYFVPGKYRLEIQHPGYLPINGKIVIAEGKKTLRIERVLRAKPRRIQLKITHDVPPPENHSPYEIILAPINNPQGARIAHDGDETEAGNYSFQIKQPGYELLADSLYICPSEDPVVIARQLLARPVAIRIQVDYDVEPPTDLPECHAVLIDTKTNTSRWVPDDKQIKPGHYYLDVKRPGYSFGPRKEIYITPGEELHVIHEKLIAKSRGS